MDATDPARILGALRPRTRAVFVEALSNPLLRLVDLPALAPELSRRGVELIVDSSLASPAVFRPIVHGATVVVHSLTKFISGHGDVTGGIVLGRAEKLPFADATFEQLKFFGNISNTLRDVFALCEFDLILYLFRACATFSDHKVGFCRPACAPYSL